MQQQSDGAVCYIHKLEAEKQQSLDDFLRSLQKNKAALLYLSSRSLAALVGNKNFIHSFAQTFARLFYLCKSCVSQEVR